MARGDMTDDDWAIIEGLLPSGRVLRKTIGVFSMA